MLNLFKYVLPMTAIAVVTVLIINIYKDFRDQIVSDFNRTQLLMLRQGSENLRSDIDRLHRELTVLAGTEIVEKMRESGRILCRMSLSEDEEILKAVTRMSSSGKILFTYPENPDVIGRDISDQEHVKRLLTTRQAVFSDIFSAVQGYRAVALHVPVFSDLNFRGSLAFLIAYDALIMRSAGSLDSGSEYFVILNSAGTILYSKYSDLTGKNLFEALGLPGNGGLERRVAKGEDSFEWEYRGQKHFVNLVSTRSMDQDLTWITVNSQDSALASLSENFRRFTWLMVILSALLVGYIVYTSRKWLYERNRQAMEDVSNQLRRSEIRFHKLFEILPDAIYISEKTGDAKSRIIDLNSEAERQTGYSRGELLGQNVADFLSTGEISTRENDEMRDHILKGEQTQIIEKKRRKDGGEIWTSVHFAAMDEGGKKYIISVNRDVTEQMEMQDKLIQSQKMESIGVLTGAIAHDFNNILTAINGFSEIGMLTSEANDEIHGLFRNINNSGEHARNLIRQLLVYSRQQSTPVRTLDLEKVVQNVHPMMERVLSRGIEFTIAGSGGSLHIQGDAGQLEQILMNLVLNANDAVMGGVNGEKGRITVVTDHGPDKEGNEGIILRVEDNGEGIPKEIQQRIFDPFFTTKKHKGTGLGLYTVYKLVERMAGKVEIDSRPGRGTRITIWFPPSTELPAEVAVSEQPESVRGGKETILFVEDNDSIVKFIEPALEGLGYTVKVAGDGRSALELLQSTGKVDLVITDIDMPRMNGVELALHLEKEEPGLPLIFTSGYADTVPGAREFLEKRRERYLTKPYTLLQLTQRIRNIFD